MEKRNLMRQIPKKEKIVKEKKEQKTLDESEVFKTETKHDLEVLPINEEPTETKEDKKEVITETPKPEKKKRQIKREMCECGKDYAINAHHFHLNTKQHKEWLKSQKEKEEPQNVEVEKISLPVSKETETKKQEVVKPKQINQPFEIDYDRIINGVSQNYINYKLQKQEKKKQAPVDNYKQKYEELLKQQEKDKKKHQADMYLYKQNQVFGRPRQRNGWFN